jgi:hypothetical protein
MKYYCARCDFTCTILGEWTSHIDTITHKHYTIETKHEIPVSNKNVPIEIQRLSADFRKNRLES